MTNKTLVLFLAALFASMFTVTGSALDNTEAASEAVAASTFAILDADGDGAISISETESTPVLMENWSTVDANQDGQMDAAELSSVVKVIEVIAESKKSWDDAAENAIKEASKSVRNIKSLYVQEMQAVVEDGKITRYRMNAKISFVLD